MIRSCLREEVRKSPEFQSCVVRLALWLVVGLFLGAGGLAGHYDVDWRLFAILFALHFVWFVALLAHVVRRPALDRVRSCLGIAADLSAITLVIYLCGRPLAPLFLVYVLSFLSQGMRFGRMNLAIASIGSVVCYGVIATAMGAWQAYAFDAAFVLAALIVLPLYQYSLLRHLQRARREAEVANRARGDFLATMTHELRTPLSGIVGMTGLMHGTDLDVDQRRYADAISSSANTLQALIGDILDLSKVDAGMLALDEQWFDPRATVTGVCRNLTPSAVDKGVELVCRIDADLPAQVWGDPVRLEQILYNLVGNAVKFTAEGRVCVEAERMPAAAGLGEPHVLFRIRDTGIGMSADELDRIFDTFWQADRSASRVHGGAGLGTTISYRLARAMGGTLAVDSREGAGTTFEARLPLLREGAAAVAPPSPPASLAGRRVLAIEPDAEARSVLARACADAGMDCRACASLREACEGPADGGLDASRLLVVADGALNTETSVAGEPGTSLQTLAGAGAGIVRLRHHGLDGGADEGPGVSVPKPFEPVDLWRAMARAAP